MIFRSYGIRVSFLAWNLQLYRYSLLTMDKNWSTKDRVSSERISNNFGSQIIIKKKKKRKLRNEQQNGNFNQRSGKIQQRGD